MDVGSLFRVVDASSLEATVLSEADKRARNSTTVPTFGVTDSLGFGASSLRNFCPAADDIVLSMAVEATRQEGQKLRERGVTSLAARDRVSRCTTMVPSNTFVNPVRTRNKTRAAKARMYVRSSQY